MNKGFVFFVGEKEKLMLDIFIFGEKINEVKDGDKVVVCLIKWE